MMANLILPSGPRGAGKTTYCKKFSIKNPDYGIVSRDSIAQEMFNKTLFDPSCELGKEFQVLEQCWRRAISMTTQKQNIIFDVWNGTDNERKILVEYAKRLGFTKIICWYFTTPLELQMKWIAKKPDPTLWNITREQVIEAYECFHTNARDIYSIGFDQVNEINPVPITL